MQEKDKKYIREHIRKESIKEISGKLGLKERKIRKFLEKEKTGEQTEDLHQGVEDSVLKAFDQKYRFLIIFALLLWGFIVYSNTFLSSFHFDDKLSIVNNPSIRHIRNLGNIWNFWPTRFITYLSLAFNYHFHRLDVLGYHLFNLAIHLGSGILVWWLSLLTFSTPVMKDQKIARHAKLISFFAGLLFVVHPIQTQAVTYIIQRAASLAAFFYVTSLSLYAKSRLSEASSRRRLYYSGSLILAVMAMFTKEIAITLPLMIYLYEFSFFKTKERFNGRRILPFLFCLSIIPLTMLLTKSVNMGEMRRVTEDISSIVPMRYLLTQFRVIITYIRLLFVPLNQNLDYDYPIANTLLELPVFVSLLFLVVILIVAIRLFRNYRLVSFGICWFLLALLPESSVIPIKDIIFEHRLYLPMIGFSLFLTSGLYYFFEKNNLNLKVMIAIFALLIISNSALTYARNFLWKDDLSLWSDTVKKSPHKARPYMSRGNAYAQKGNLDQSLLDYNKAIEIKPDYATAYNNRGLVYQDKGNLDQALLDYNKAIKIKPDYAEAYNDRGLAYQDKGNLDQALLDFNKALEIKPDYAEAYNNRGNAYFKKGNLDQAFLDYDKAIEIKPDCATAYNNRGLAYQDKGNLDQALLDFNKALEIKPDCAEAYYNRGVAYKNIGNLDQALLDFNKVLEIKPDYAEAYYNRGNAYFKKGNFDQALLDYDRAIELKPDYAKAYYNRAAVYFKKQEYVKSWEDVHRAQTLKYNVNPSFIEQLKKASGKEE